MVSATARGWYFLGREAIEGDRRSETVEESHGARERWHLKRGWPPVSTVEEENTRLVNGH